TATWSYPSRTQCIQCHSQAAGGTIGLETAQLNGDFVYTSTNRRSNQLATLDHIGMFSAPLGEPPDALPPLSDPAGQDPLAARAATCTATARTATGRTAAARARWTCATPSRSTTPTLATPTKRRARSAPRPS